MDPDIVFVGGMERVAGLELFFPESDSFWEDIGIAPKISNKMSAQSIAAWTEIGWASRRKTRP